MPNSSLLRPLALFLIAACPGEDEPPEPPDPPEEVNEWVVAGRYVAIFDKTADDACPEATDTSWSGKRLFRSGDALDLIGDETLPEPLERFCRYTWLGEDPPAAEPTFDPPWKDKLYKLDPDRDVLMPQTYLGGDPMTRDELAAAFRQLSGTRGSGAAAQVYEQTETTARVAVIDSVRYADAGLPYAYAPPWYRHGLAMAELVHTVRCPHDEKDCDKPQFHAQAFPYVGTSPQVQAGGGPLGSISSLAHALGEAVIRWRALDLPDAPLILNMSVAWDPTPDEALTPSGQEAEHTDLLVTPSATVPADVQAVHAILVYAGCLDALAIAASGNNTGAPCVQTGAMAPAMWERYPMPDAERCQELFGPEPLPDRRTGDPGVEAAASSLVYAAGGVAADGLPIPIARPDSTPPRVVPAFQAVVGAGPRQTDAWTGTSVAAATMSGISASIWTHHPALTPSQVIGLITSSGEQTHLPVAPPATGEARLITGHAAFARLCATRSDGAACTNPYAEATTPPSLPEEGGSPSDLITLECTETTTSCGSAPASILRCNKAGAAPTSVPAPSPWLRPQPDIPYCPYCPVKGGKLTMSLNPDHSTGISALDNPTIEFRLANGTYVSAGLGQITVDPDDEDVDLARYSFPVNNTIQPIAGDTTPSIAAVLNANNVTTATLGIYIVDTVTGEYTRATSAVPVDPCPLCQ